MKRLFMFILMVCILVSMSGVCFGYYCYECGEQMDEYCSNQMESWDSWTCSYGGTEHYAEKEYWYTNYECPDCEIEYPKWDDHVEWTRHHHRDCPYYGLMTWCPY